ncbi:mitotic checkpoint protein BUB3.3-like [Punica granatum]|uniref:Mitotic checkpoint protein BUB3.3-like n=1 Tax=Punica granatum TaxID=22663 RepID=A0A6P8C084_PUNGR|nr:mitotic checkpoint protein BUB3.3-like [Punica granatum]
MKGARLEFGSPISDAVSRIRFAPRTNNLLISSWDSCLRLYDVEGSALRLEAPSQAALLNCCFQGESVAFSAGSDCAIRRHDMHSGTQEIMGHHDDIATCVEHSDESSILITTGLDKMIIFWDPRLKRALVSKSLQVEVESISLAGFELMLAMGSSAYLYDLRNLDGPLQSKESKVDARIRCISSASSCSGFAVGSVDGRVAVEVSASSTSKNTAYTFRCHPRAKNGNHHLVSVNDIVFNPCVLGAFVTGDNEGYVAAWDFQNRRRLFELPRFPNGVASMSYNKNGDLLAIAASYSYQEADELVEPPQIFVYNMDEDWFGSASTGRRKNDHISRDRKSSVRPFNAIKYNYKKKKSRQHSEGILLYGRPICDPTVVTFEGQFLGNPRLPLSSSICLSFQIQSLCLSPSVSLSVAGQLEAMSDEEHHFESKADAGASKTYPQQAGTIRKNGYIVIKNRPCKVVEVSTSKTGKHGHAKCHFVAIDIFNGKKLEDIVPSSHNCDVPHVTRTDYQLIDISEDGFVSLLTENGNTKDDLRLPTDENLLSQIKDGFGDGKDLVVTVMSSMGEEQICALKDIGPK